MFIGSSRTLREYMDLKRYLLGSVESLLVSMLLLSGVVMVKLISSKVRIFTVDNNEFLHSETLKLKKAFVTNYFDGIHVAYIYIYISRMVMVIRKNYENI